MVAHPSVALADPGLGAERGLVGLRLGRISAAAPDPAALVRAALSGAVSGGGRLRVLVDAADEPWVGSAVRKLAAAGEVDLVVHRAEDWPQQLQQLHVAAVAVQCWTEPVRRLGIPLVVTVHRLGAADAADDCPRDPAMDAHLEAVLSTAEVVFTLTPGAADDIA